MKKKEMNAWEHRETAECYAEEVDIIVPNRKEMLSIISKLATEWTPDSPTIADLGCGLGDVAAAILELRPKANLQLVDLSDEMIRLSGIRFKQEPKVKITKHDLNIGLPASFRSLKFDSVASCFTLHHIEFENRIGLYRDIWNQLKDDALFINGDFFKCDSPLVDQWEFDYRIKWIMLQMNEQQGKEISFEELKKDRLENQKRMGDKPGTVWQMRDDMKRAGFQHVDCLWKNQSFAVLSATK